MFDTLVDAQVKNPYAIYSLKQKVLSELEWRLAQANLKLGSTGYFVSFDKSSTIFKVDKFTNAHTLSTTPPVSLREILTTDCNLVEAVIGSEFPEFGQRGSKDLKVTFFIGEASARIFANYSSQTLSFTDDYYNFRKEHGQ